jgi:hypothetical protein
MLSGRKHLKVGECFRPTNYRCWAVGVKRGDGFHVRFVTWSKVFAQESAVADETVRKALVMVEREPRP